MVYDDDVAYDNTCAAKIEEYFLFGEANASFEAYVKSWNLMPSLEVDTRGLPEGSLCLKAACKYTDLLVCFYMNHVGFVCFSWLKRCWVFC